MAERGIRRRVFQILDHPSTSSKLGRIVDLVLSLIIALNVTAVILETERSVWSLYWKQLTYFRLLKLERYWKSFHTIMAVFREKKEALAVTAMVIFIALIF